MRQAAKRIAEWSVDVRDGEYLAVVQYGIEVLMENILRIIVILSTGMLFGYGKEAAIALFSFAILRMNAGGIHAESSLGCTVVTSGIVLSGILAKQYFHSSIFLLLLCYIISNTLVYRYAPNGSESCALLEKSYKKKKKMYALITNQVLFAVSYISDFGNLILVSVMAECLSLVVFQWEEKIYEKSKKNSSSYR